MPVIDTRAMVYIVKCSYDMATAVAKLLIYWICTRPIQKSFAKELIIRCVAVVITNIKAQKRSWCICLGYILNLVRLVKYRCWEEDKKQLSNKQTRKKTLRHLSLWKRTTNSRIHRLFFLYNLYAKYIIKSFWCFLAWMQCIPPSYIYFCLPSNAFYLPLYLTFTFSKCFKNLSLCNSFTCNGNATFSKVLAKKILCPVNIFATIQISRDEG